MEVSERPNGVFFSEISDKEQDEKILQPFTYILQSPCTRFRMKFFHAFNYWLQVPADKFAVLEELFEMIHVGCILFDDIQDNCLVRSDIPAAHSVYGVAWTISAACFVYSKSLQKAVSANHPELVKLYTEMMLETSRGQGMDIYWRENYICPSEEEYLEIITRKIAEHFLLGVRMMQLFSDNKADFTKLTKTIWRYFQILDDYCNLCPQEHSHNKGYCEDLTEGKFSFPVIHAIKCFPHDNQVINILRQRTRDVELKKYCLTLLEKFGSLSYTRRKLEELDAETRAEVANLGGNPILVEFLDEVMDWKRSAVENNPEK